MPEKRIDLTSVFWLGSHPKFTWAMGLGAVLVDQAGCNFFSFLQKHTDDTEGLFISQEDRGSTKDLLFGATGGTTYL